MGSQEEVKSAINQRLIECGEKEKLKSLLRGRLLECGWREQVKLHAKEIVKEKGLEKVKLEDLVRDITPKGRALVPDSVKKELVQQIKEFLAHQQDI